MEHSEAPPISFAVFKEYLDFVREMREKENTFVDAMQTILDDFVCAGMYSRWETELFDLLERTFYDSPDDKWSSDIEYWVYECCMGEKEGKIFLEEDANGNPAETVVFKTDEDVYNYLVRMYPSRKARALERERRSSPMQL